MQEEDSVCVGKGGAQSGSLRRVSTWRSSTAQGLGMGRAGYWCGQVKKHPCEGSLMSTGTLIGEEGIHAGLDSVGSILGWLHLVT